jgi:hypothetical protein
MISGAPSDFLGAALLIGFIAIAPMIVAEMSFLRFLTLTFFVTVSTAFAKGPYMYAIVIVIITLTLATRRPRHFLIAPGVSGCAVLVFFSQSNVATSIGFGFFPLASLGEHSFASGLAGRLLAIAFVLMPLAIGIISAIALNLVVRTPTVSAQVSWSLLVVMFCALASRLFLAADARTHSYFFEPGLIAGGLMVMLAFRESRENRLQQVPSIIVIAIAIVMLWQFVIPEVVPSLNSGSIAAKSLRMLREATVVNLLLLGLVILVYLGHIIRRNRPRANSPIRVLLALPLLPPALLAATNVPSMFSEIEQRHRKTQSGEEDLWRERVIGSSEAREVARVLGELNINDELVAYTSCGNDLKRGCEPPLVFVAYSGSRFLAAYSDLKAEWGLANLAADQDYELTLSLLKIPASEAINNLRLRNVALLVVDLRRATPPWISSALASGTTMLYSNESFAIIALSPPSEP